MGFGSGLTGVGGPVLSVPLMVILGFTPLTSIATSQVIQITAATSGSISYFANGFVDLHMAFLVTAAELVGVVAGARLAHSVSSGVQKNGFCRLHHRGRVHLRPCAFAGLIAQIPTRRHPCLSTFKNVPFS